MRSLLSLWLVMMVVLCAACQAPAPPVVPSLPAQPATPLAADETAAQSTALSAPQPTPTLDVAALAPTPVMATPIPAPAFTTTKSNVARQLLDPPDAFPAGQQALAGRTIEPAATPLNTAALTDPPQGAVLDLTACATQHACSREEADVLAAGPPGVVRTDGALRITHSNGTVSVLRDIAGEDNIWVSYRYLGYVPTITQHVLEVGYYEHADFLLLAAADGAATSLWTLPMPSPDGALLVSARPRPFSTMKNLPVVIWQFKDGVITRQHELMIYWYDTRIAGAEPRIEWLDARTLQIRAAQYQGPLLADVGVLTVRLEDTGPSAYLDGTLLYRPWIDAEQIKALNRITTTQTIVFAQPVVYDVRTAWPKEQVYQDRDYRFRELPAAVLGLNYFLFSNSAMQQSGERYLHFTLSSPATLYVAIDAEAAALPGWMADWQRLDEQVLTDDIALQLYRKDFPAGEVVLGGTWMPPASNVRSHYLVFVP